MSLFKDTTIQILTKYTTEDWYELFTSVFHFKKLENELAIPYDYSSEYFIELNNLLLQNVEIQRDFQLNIISYYFDLSVTTDNYQKIYSLHWLFANLKIRINTDGFYHQFFKDTLNGIYHENIHLHTSLLSLLLELPNTKRFEVLPYLFSNSLHIGDPSFYRVASRYLIQKNSISEYLEYIGIISHDKNVNVPKVIAESIMDCRDFNGSFKLLFFGIKDFWNQYYRNHFEIAKAILGILNTKYLKEGKIWYDNDNYAPLFKTLLNSYNFPPPIPIIEKAYSSILSSKGLNKNDLFNATTFILNNNGNWERKIVIDSFDEDNAYLISIDKYDRTADEFYKKIYGITKNQSFVQVKELGFAEFMTRNCNPKYNSVKQFDTFYSKELQDA